jgi:hypothetical protein
MIQGCVKVGYSESWTYNALARPVSRIITAGGSNYQYNYAFNSIGRLSQLTYPTQQKDPTLGNEELKSELMINTVTGEVAFGRAGTLNFDNPSKLDPPPTAPEPVASPIELEEPHVEIDMGE